ncbi:MAG: radical SAM protein, partial [Candidatus Methanofastidiosia archaeon]
TLDISGGEMLTKKEWEKIIDFCKDTFILNILTNGTLITEGIADTLSYSDRVSISLYGADAETHDKVTGVKGSFEQVLRGTALLTKRDIEVRAAILIFPFNVYQLEDIVKLAISLGCKRVQVGIICSVGRAENKNWDLSEKERAWLDEKMNELKEKEEYKDIEIRWEEEDEEYLEKKENKCGAGVIMWEITSNGDIYPCATIRIPMGNVAKENLEDICKSPAAKFFQDLLTPHKKLCGDCQYLYLCKGCHGQAFAHFFKVKNCPWVKQFEKAPPLFKNAIHEKRKKKENEMIKDVLK